jgi:hypothetical protein
MPISRVTLNSLYCNTRILKQYKENPRRREKQGDSSWLHTTWPQRPVLSSLRISGLREQWRAGIHSGLQREGGEIAHSQRPQQFAIEI